MNITVYKFDPSVDSKPYYISGTIEYKEDMTALQALIDFHENVAPVNFDYSCAARLCGRCAMLVNGQPHLICATKIEDGDYTFEPLPGYPVVRDLVVDKSAADRELEKIYRRVKVEPYTAEQALGPVEFDYEYRDLMYPLEFCTRCGSCTSVCPVHAQKPNEYVGPMAMIATAYRHLDPLDQGDRLMEATGAGLFHCIECGTCTAACAQLDILHVELFKLLKDRARERGIAPSYA